MFASFAHHLGTACISFNGYMAHRTLFDISTFRTVEQRKAFKSTVTFLTVSPNTASQHVLPYQFFTMFLTIHTWMPAARTSGTEFFFTFWTIDRSCFVYRLFSQIGGTCTNMAYCIATWFRTPCAIRIQGHF